MAPEYSILIPNWNGEAFIARALAATILSAQSSAVDWELIVVDDASTDRSCDIITCDFPQVQVHRNSINLGFGATCNLGVRLARGRIVILLNNDLVPSEALVRELISPLKDESVFGVSARTLDWDKSLPNHANMAARWNDGVLDLTYEDSREPGPTMFIQGGACSVRRDEFLRLGGFCELFAPGYWEDYDLSYLALKAGWQNIYNPRAEAYHLGQASMSRAHEAGKLAAIKGRNFFLFHWLNLTDADMLKAHTSAIPRIGARALSNWRNRAQMRGLLKALPLASAVARERMRRSSLIRKSDHEVLRPFASHGKLAQEC